MHVIAAGFSRPRPVAARGDWALRANAEAGPARFKEHLPDRPDVARTDHHIPS
ncbi:hypothetical protein EDD29_4995 [Actinocorallia herbida]|uniref:Uncharacterized protein n=1 Tax=Actinocorallia herbida TaxID=58109 RepID=A0A3N1D1I9_9ACTN|nr:hypothetical protein [Actinocorallia herbida]ROO87389.1 hypothetical protein EDD29_4995 [Actinocorallia herbida]